MVRLSNLFWRLKMSLSEALSQPHNGEKREATTESFSNETPTCHTAVTEIERLLPVVAHAVAVFGDENKASHWFQTRLPLLGDRSPSQVLEQDDGIDQIEQILTRIEHNIPS